MSSLDSVHRWCSLGRALTGGRPPILQDSRTLARAVDYKKTVFLPQTDFPMRANLPEREPEILRAWEEMGLYQRLRKSARGREKFILHDGPPYANDAIHIGHALNKILKDLVNRFQQMLGELGARVSQVLIYLLNIF